MVVYIIRNKINGKFYVGSTKNFTKRKGHHLRSLRKGDHHSLPLQRAWNKYKEENFEFSVLFTYDKKEDALREEQRIIEKGAHYNACSNVYKVADNGIPVLQYDLEGNYIKEWESMLEASEGLSISHSDIVQCCKGRKYRVSDFYFRYKLNPKSRKSKITKEQITERNQINRARKYIVSFPDGHEEIVVGLKKFCEENNLYYPSAHQVVLGTRNRKSHKGYKFKKYEES